MADVRNFTVPNIFIRTGVFGSFTKGELSIQSLREDSFKYDGQKIKVSGNPLSVQYDLPVFSVIYQQWKFENGKKTKEQRTMEVKVPLNLFSSINKNEKVFKRRKDCLPLENSLERLLSCQISLINLGTKTESKLQILERTKNDPLNYKNKEITVVLSEDMIEHCKRGKCTYIPIKDYMELPNQLTQALYLYLKSQRRDYVDFKIKTLCSLTGLDFKGRTSKEDKKREALKASFKHLEKIGFILESELSEKKDEYRILCKHHNYTEEERENLTSNFKKIKSTKKKQGLIESATLLIKTSNDTDDDLPF